MEPWNIVLEFVRAVLSAHVVWGAVVVWAAYLFRGEVRELVKRPFSVKGPGGYELRAEESTQSAKTRAAETTAHDEVGRVPVLADPAKTPGQDSAEGWRQAARVWEYRYLHYFLARGTQVVLDWLATLPRPVTVQAADAYWQAVIPDASERRAILDALRWHDLVAVEGDRIQVTDKGSEYREFRGPLPPLPSRGEPTGSK